jgi:flagellar basal body-associated protein FliL
VMKNKLVLLPVVLLVLVGAGGAYWFKFKPSGPVKKPPPPHVEGSLFTLEPEFVVNLTDNHYGKVTVALLLKEEPKPAQLVATSEGAEKFVQDPVVRSTITDDLTGISTNELIDHTRRDALRKEILKDLVKATDIEVTGVLFTDVVVQ